MDMTRWQRSLLIAVVVTIVVEIGLIIVNLGGLVSIVLVLIVAFVVIQLVRSRRA